MFPNNPEYGLDGFQNETGKMMTIPEVRDGTWGPVVSLLLHVLFSWAGDELRGELGQGGTPGSPGPQDMPSNTPSALHSPLGYCVAFTYASPVPLWLGTQ